jgi:N-acetylneuraminate lyase
MNKKIFKIIAAPLTGFNSDGSINLDIIPRYAAMLYKNGISGVFVNGTTGEGPSLTFEERKALASHWVESSSKDMRVIVHVGYIDHARSQALAAHAADIGADSIGEIGPPKLKSRNIEALVEYTATTASAAPDLPYYYYHMPSANNLYFSMAEYLVLAEKAIPNLAGIKFTHSDISEFQTCIRYLNGKYDIFFGRDEYLIDGLKAGAQNALGSTYNVITGLYYQLITAYKSGNLETAYRLQSISADTCRILYASGSFGYGLKTLLRRIGLDLGGMRRPNLNLSQKEVLNLEASLQKAGVISYLNNI